MWLPDARFAERRLAWRRRPTLQRPSRLAVTLPDNPLSGSRPRRCGPNDYIGHLSHRCAGEERMPTSTHLLLIPPGHLPRLGPAQSSHGPASRWHHTTAVDSVHPTSEPDNPPAATRHSRRAAIPSEAIASPVPHRSPSCPQSHLRRLGKHAPTSILRTADRDLALRPNAQLNLA